MFYERMTEKEVKDFLKTQKIDDMDGIAGRAITETLKDLFDAKPDFVSNKAFFLGLITFACSLGATFEFSKGKPNGIDIMIASAVHYYHMEKKMLKELPISEVPEIVDLQKVFK